MPPLVLRLTLGFAALHSGALAQELVQPGTYRSPSGEFELFVGPTEPHGTGPGTYRLSRAQHVLWERELPFTFVEALVRDDGSSGGWALTQGSRGAGELVLALLTADGAVRGEERVPRALSRYEHGGFEPELFALRTDDDRLMAWTHATGPCSWALRWSTGESLERTAPPSESAIAARPPELARAPEWRSYPELALESLGHVILPWPDLAACEIGPKRTPHRVAIDRTGRAWITELSTNLVHVFDESGQALFVRDGGFRPYRPSDWLAVRDDGGLIVCGDEQRVEFAPDGEVVGRTRVDAVPPRWLFAPAGEHWEVSARRIALVAADGKRLDLDRGANERWFNDLQSASASPDGGLAVLDGPSPLEARHDASLWVHLFEPTGKARASLRLPDEFVDWRIAFDGRSLAIACARELRMLRADGAPIGRFVWPEALASAPLVFFAPGGDQLWVFPHCRAEMFRFAAPR